MIRRAKILETGHLPGRVQVSSAAPPRGVSTKCRQCQPGILRQVASSEGWESRLVRYGDVCGSLVRVSCAVRTTSHPHTCRHPRALRTEHRR
eukprot:356154-Chlamydomonas_euryale.AAC.2